ncbi:MAG: hypothetical protein JWO26_1043 [Rhodospirillales bacterium]|jgi:hypothetical protein|nr:hypothetical protein [Rhodospirillales bacterium]MDB5381411.1 hypothetical protein [Rhodospirillales bacterium]
MRRDPVLALLRLRGFATREARRVLGVRVHLEISQLAEATISAGAPLREQAAGGAPLLIAAWMPRALNEVARARAKAAQASAARDAAQASLTQARRQERILENLAGARAAERAMLAARRDQARMDDRAQARHGAFVPAWLGDATEGRHRCSAPTHHGAATRPHHTQVLHGGTAQAVHGETAPARYGDVAEAPCGDPGHAAGELQRLPHQVGPAPRSHVHPAEQRITTP